MPEVLDLDRALDECAREPIHIPGAVQPHGVMLVLDQSSQEITHAAGDLAGLLGQPRCTGKSLGAVLGDPIATRVAAVTHSGPVGGYVGRIDREGRPDLDVSAHVSEGALIVEIEPAMSPAMPASVLLGQLEAAAAAFERAPNLKALCDRAAVEYQRLTGFDRVMIYRFLDEDAGAVLAECVTAGLPSFLNHHFPGSDIPAQARALYVRNLVRVIPDVAYVPAPLDPPWTAARPLDMSDCVLRSVSPVHMQYLRNMGVQASASVSIVKDGALWGLIACHHSQPRLMPYDIRGAARALAAGLARQVRAKEDAETYRERLRLRGLEDEAASRFARLGGLEANLAAGLSELRAMLAADGVAAIRGHEVLADGAHPPLATVRKLAQWMLGQEHARPFATDRLAEVLPEAEPHQPEASGLLGLVVNDDEPFVLLWFRAEQVEVVNWAGNPHKAVELAAGERLTPRASFEAWRETVRGRSRPWSLAEADAAQRLKGLLLEQRGQRRLRDLNDRLTEAVAEKDALLAQKELVLKEVNHRIQNSLQLVSSFLALQAKAAGDDTLTAAFDEARQRISAVSLVHRRLYRADQIESVDLARYLEDLVDEMGRSMGLASGDRIQLEADPVLIQTDRAVTLGLVVTELVINANKYAYGGDPGPVQITVDAAGGRLRIVVADHGRGKLPGAEGFGSRMMAAMLRQLRGDIAYEDNRPGLRAVLTVPVAAGG